MPAKFEIIRPKPGEFRWELKSQGRVLARSDPYAGRAACLRAMEAFRSAAPTADIVDTTAKEVRFAPAATVPQKAVRGTGRVVGKAAAKVAEVPSVVTSAVEKIVDAVIPTPRKRSSRTT